MTEYELIHRRFDNVERELNNLTEGFMNNKEDVEKRIMELAFALSGLNARLTAIESKIICPRHSDKKSNEIWCFK